MWEREGRRDEGVGGRWEGKGLRNEGVGGRWEGEGQIDVLSTKASLCKMWCSGSSSNSV